MSRSTKEWHGKTDDSRPPKHVRVRIFDAHGGICHIAKRKIVAGEPWDLDHVIALINGGENRESNMAPALRDKHREKTKADVAEKSRVYERRASYIGAEQPRRKMQGPRFRRRSPQHTATRPIKRKFAAGDATMVLVDGNHGEATEVVG